MEIKVGRCVQCGNCCRHTFNRAWVPISEQALRYNQGEHIYYQFRSVCEAPTGERDEHWEEHYYALKSECKMLIRNGKKYACKLHGSSEQPRMCKTWPVHEDDAFYKAIELLFGTCGYHFIESEPECPQPLA